MYDISKFTVGTRVRHTGYNFYEKKGWEGLIMSRGKYIRVNWDNKEVALYQSNSKYILDTLEIIPEPKQGQMVYVRDSSQGDWSEREFIFDRGPAYDYRYVCANEGSQVCFTAWAEMRTELETEVTELTLSEIADKLNIDVKNLRIKD